MSVFNEQRARQRAQFQTEVIVRAIIVVGD